MARRKSRKSEASRLIVVVRGGMVQDIITNRPAEILLVDHDNIAAGDCPGLFLESFRPGFVRKHWQRLCRGELSDGV